MIKDEISALQLNATKPCVTITFPLDHTFGNIAQNDILLKKSLGKAEKLLSEFNEDHAGENVMELLREAKINMGSAVHPDGFAIFACPDYIKTIYLSYQPEEQVQVNDSFDMREVLYLLRQSVVYFSLCIGKDGARLFTCAQDVVHEVKDEFFPIKYNDSYQHEKPHALQHGHSSLSAGKDKSNVIEERMEALCRLVDKHLAGYMKKDIPLVLLGINDMISKFMHETHYKHRIAGVVDGSHLHSEESDIARLAYPAIKAWQRNHEADIFTEMDRAIDKHLFACGIGNVRDAINAGNCDTLIVEKGYDEKVEADGPIASTKQSHAVNALIDKALAKDCKIVVVKENSMELFQHIGLIMRYRD